MSRRRRGLLSRSLGLLTYAWRVIVSWVLWPVYFVFDLFQAGIHGYRSSLARRPWRQHLVDALLFLPRLLVVVWHWCWQAILTWPRVMRLRDLASGLPALLAGGAAVAILFFFSKDEAELAGAYLQRSNSAYEKAAQESDPEKRTADFKLAQFYARALVKLKPTDLNYRYYVAYIYQDLGEYERAQAIMDSLAPRNNIGFAKAHLWQADQYLAPDRPLTSDSLDAAEAHLLRALPTYSPPEEIYRRLGELYYWRYVHYRSDPRQPAREVYLLKADQYLSKLVDRDVKLGIILAEIRLLQGRTKEAELDVQAVAIKLAAQLANFPDDVEARVLLARSFRLLHRFGDAVNVLREGQNLRPNERFAQELSTVFWYLSVDIRQREPKALSAQFEALKNAYLIYPANSFPVYRFVESLTSGTPEEAEFSRAALQSLVEGKAPGQLPAFLLGFDCLRRSLPTKAESYFAMVRAMPADSTPQLVAGMSLAVFSEQLKKVNPTAVRALFDAALHVWPTHPDLLSVRGQLEYSQKNFSSALNDLTRALKSRPNDVKLHEMVSAVYQQLGLPEQARKHKQEAEKLRTNVPVPSP